MNNGHQYNKQRIDNQCFNCTDRKIGCHSTCESYKQFREYKDALNGKVAKDNEFGRYREVNDRRYKRQPSRV